MKHPTGKLDDSAYFISNKFVEKIFDDVSQRQDRNKDVILLQIEKMQ